MRSIDTWSVVNTRFDAHTLGQYNSVCTVSNGYLGLKGNLCEDRDGYCPVTLINGVYDELDMFGQIRCSNLPRRYLDPAHFDSAGRSPAVANLPNPLFTRVYVGDEEISLTRGAISGFEQGLLMQGGVYRYRFQYDDRRGRSTMIVMSRFASLSHPHRAYMRYVLKPLNHDAPIRVAAGIDGSTFSNTTRERQYSVVSAEAGADGRCLLHARTIARRHDVHVGVVTVPRPPAGIISARGIVEHNAAYTLYEFRAAPGEPIVLYRYVAMTSSEDARLGVAANVDDELAAAVAQGLDEARAQARNDWQRLWSRADVRIDGDDDAQRYLRFCLFHLLAAAPRHTDRLSVPVKLLTGEYYQGNTFYDTDLYIMPVYLFTFPEWARTHLNWRWHGLGPARQIARDLGYEGAKFAWQAGPYGEECLGKWWRFTHTNIHINADVAYAVMQYYHATGDEAFLRERGAEILAEAARFFASRAVHDAARDRYDLRDVAGPDEGHCESTNNFYTNYLARRTLEWAAEAVDRLRRAAPDAFAALAGRLGLRDDEPRRWRRVAERLTLLFDPQTKIYEQCEGFYRLEPVPPDLLAKRRTWFETVFPYQALNQPDVVMAMVLFRDAFDPEVLRANWEFYKDKSLNFSSMSFAINAIMAADMGEMDRAYREFLVSAGQDVDEELTGRKDTYAGLHGTAAGGAWMAAVLGFGGVRLREQGLEIHPRLPSGWTGLRFNLVLRGQVLEVAVDQEAVTLTPVGEAPPALPITVAGRPAALTPGRPCRMGYGEKEPFAT